MSSYSKKLHSMRRVPSKNGFDMYHNIDKLVSSSRGGKRFAVNNRAWEKEGENSFSFFHFNTRLAKITKYFDALGNVQIDYTLYPEWDYSPSTRDSYTLYLLPSTYVLIFNLIKGHHKYSAIINYPRTTDKYQILHNSIPTYIKFEDDKLVVINTSPIVTQNINMKYVNAWSKHNLEEVLEIRKNIKSLHSIKELEDGSNGLLDSCSLYSYLIDPTPDKAYYLALNLTNKQIANYIGNNAYTFTEYVSYPAYISKEHLLKTNHKYTGNTK